MKTPEECLRHAEECDRMATTAATDLNKALLREAAGQWRKLAKEGASSSAASRGRAAKGLKSSWQREDHTK
jgi:hypothetical protein